MRVLVLGGGGFLGSHVTDRLVARGHEVTAFDRFPEGTDSLLERCGPGVRAVVGDYGDREALRGALEGQDVVYHLISATTPGSSWDAPLRELDENLRPMIAFLEVASAAKVKKIAFASSGGTVYGSDGGREPLTEDAAPRPRNPYAIGKLAAEGLLRHARDREGVAFDIYRIANAYGPRQCPRGTQGVIGIWIAAILGGRPVEVFGDETTVRDYVYVGDVAELMTYSLRDPHASGLFNVGTGRPTSIIDLLEIFRRVAPLPFEAIMHGRRGFDARGVVLDSRRLLTAFGDFQFTALEDGVARTFQCANESRIGTG